MWPPFFFAASALAQTKYNNRPEWPAIVGGKQSDYHSPVRSQAKAFNFASVSCDNLRPSEYEILAVTFLVERMPGITALTASWLSVKRSANSATLPASSPSNDFKRSTRS